MTRATDLRTSQILIDEESHWSEPVLVNTGGRSEQSLYRRRRRKGVPVVRDEKKFEAADCTPAMLFGVLWESLTDVVGSAATATFVRRAVKQASSRAPHIEGVVVTRERFEYRYALPDAWKTNSPEAMASLQTFAHELQQLLTELTGSVVLRRLRNVPELRLYGLFHSEVDP